MYIDIRIVPIQGYSPTSLVFINGLLRDDSVFMKGSGAAKIAEKSTISLIGQQVLGVEGSVCLRSHTQRQDLDSYLDSNYLIFTRSDGNYEESVETPVPMNFEATKRFLALLALKHGDLFRESEKTFDDESFYCNICGIQHDSDPADWGSTVSRFESLYPPPSFCRVESCMSHDMYRMIDPGYEVPKGWFDVAPAAFGNQNLIDVEALPSNETYAEPQPQNVLEQLDGQKESS